VIDDVFEDVILALQHTGDESGCHFQQAGLYAIDHFVQHSS